MNSLSFFLACVGITVVLLVVAFLTNFLLVFPKLIYNLRVPNGLGKLRTMILARVSFGQVVIAISIFCLTSRFFINDPEVLRYIIGIVLVGFGVDLCLKVVTDAITVRQQFTKEHIEKAMRIQHEMNLEKVDKLQKKAG